jgi:hypothetical protein
MKLVMLQQDLLKEEKLFSELQQGLLREKISNIRKAVSYIVRLCTLDYQDLTAQSCYFLANHYHCSHLDPTSGHRT